MNEMNGSPTILTPSPNQKPVQSSDSELLTPSEIESLRKDFMESEKLIDELLTEE